MLSVLPALLASGTTAVLLELGSRQVVAEAMSVGVLVGMQSLAAAMNRPLGNLTALGSRLQDMSADLNRLRDVERYPLPSTEDRPTRPLTPMEGTCASRRSPSATTRWVVRCWRTSAWTCRRVPGWRSSGARAVASRRWAGWSPGSTARGRDGSQWTGWSGRRPTTASGPPPSPWWTRINGCSRDGPGQRHHVGPDRR
ncbi:hypothetical protein NKG94_01935 [Micromonospora sp. M12]